MHQTFAESGTIRTGSTPSPFSSLSRNAGGSLASGAQAGAFARRCQPRGRGLEDMFGQRLFNRTTRALALTEAGEILLERGRRLLADYDELAESCWGRRCAQGAADRHRAGDVRPPSHHAHRRGFPAGTSGSGRQARAARRHVSRWTRGSTSACASANCRIPRCWRCASAGCAACSSPRQPISRRRANPKTPRSGRPRCIATSGVSPTAGHWSFGPDEAGVCAFGPG